MESLQVEVKIELGHKVSCKETLTPEGFTHDWVVFVRGPESCDISHFVDKVVFHLHESFAKPKRVLKDPPYQIAEAGYGSFFLPIEVYLKNKEEPRKLRFDYDLFLPVYGSPPIDNIRSEALTFENPTDEFRRKLVKGGGIVSGLAMTNGLSRLTMKWTEEKDVMMMDKRAEIDAKRIKHKANLEKQKALDIRKKPIEKMGERRKRSAEDVEEEGEEFQIIEQKKRRRGSETMLWLEKKAERDAKFRELQLEELRKIREMQREERKELQDLQQKQLQLQMQLENQQQQQQQQTMLMQQMISMMQQQQ